MRPTVLTGKKSALVRQSVAFRPDEGDAKHAVVAEGVGEHFAETRLEDMEREEGVGEKQDAGQGHDGDGVG